MQLKKLDITFYGEHTHLKEALDNFNGNWQTNKVRGYGIVVITIENNFTFAIPLRTNIKHSAAYITIPSHSPGVKGKGLDYSKALLISDLKYISSTVFKIPANEYKKLNNKEHHITKQYTKYVKKYINAAKSSDRNILNS